MGTRAINPEPYQYLSSNLVHLYVLHHACLQPTFGLQIIEEMARLGYKLSPGTMYPLLDSLEKKGLVRSSEQTAGGTTRRIYRATASGRKAYAGARQHVARILDVISKAETKSREKGAKKRTS
jgi:PadR family transcriptional regulator PadR